MPILIVIVFFITRLTAAIKLRPCVRASERPSVLNSIILQEKAVSLWHFAYFLVPLHSN